MSLKKRIKLMSQPTHYNFGTVQDIFIKLHTNIKHEKLTCRVQEPWLLNMYFLSYVPLKFVISSSVDKIMSAL